VLDRTDDAPLERCAEIVLYTRAQRVTSEVRVSLTKGRTLGWERRTGVQPSMTAEEIEACEALLKADPRWQEALRRRGVDDLSLVSVDPWAAGFTGAEDHPEKRRIARPLSFVRSSPQDNAYARPVENLVAVVDLDRMEVDEVIDHGVVPLPELGGNYIPELLAKPENHPHVPELRGDVKPLEIRQPDGSSFTVEDHTVRWQKWQLTVGFTPREALVLHEVGYHDQGRLRPVLYRGSLSEMYVPYGDPAPMHANKNVFDEGEYGLGFLCNSLQLGCDCLGEIHYFDAVVNDQDGNPVVLENAICLHEEDYGIAWKHTDFHTNHLEVRRQRRLVVSCFATAGNYDYGFFWYLYTDGTIEFEVKTTGIITTGALPPGEQAPHGTTVAPGLYGPNHQHWFNVRLDMQVDGLANAVYEVDSEAVPQGPENPTANAWRPRYELLRSEQDAQRLVDPLRNRYWLIRNATVRNGHGQPVAYKLVPGHNGHPPQGEGSQVHARGQFCYKHLWVTRYHPGERYAAGEYPPQHPGGDGLSAYVAQDRRLENEDVVVWYSFASHHVVRPEDWPVTPTVYTGFHLHPAGFFDANPAIDLPRPGACAT
jgi:primary-amine oxidase